MLKPLLDRVLVKVNEELEMTEGGIYIPENAQEKPQLGVVLAVGPGVRNNVGDLIPITGVKVGDTIYFTKYGGTEIKLDGENLRILSEKDILGVLC